MLCFVCLSEQRADPNKAVTYVQGTSVCRDHLTAVGSADMMSLMHKLGKIAERVKERNQIPHREVQLEGNGRLS